MLRRPLQFALQTTLVVALAGCAGHSAQGSNSSSSRGLPSAASPATTSATTSGALTDTATDSTCSDSTSPDTDQTSTVPSVVPPSKRGQTLGLTDFFNPTQDWIEQRFDVGSTKQIRGIGQAVVGCGSDYAKVLELRLANAFDTISLSVGQANDSVSSSERLTVEIRANGRQIDIEDIPFNQLHKFQESVKDVNAFQVKIYLDSKVDGCGLTGPATAVLTDVQLQ